MGGDFGDFPGGVIHFGVCQHGNLVLALSRREQSFSVTLENRQRCTQRQKGPVFPAPEHGPIKGVGIGGARYKGFSHRCCNHLGEVEISKSG